MTNPPPEPRAPSGGSAPDEALWRPEEQEGLSPAGTDRPPGLWRWDEDRSGPGGPAPTGVQTPVWSSSEITELLGAPSGAVVDPVASAPGTHRTPGLSAEPNGKPPTERRTHRRGSHAAGSSRKAGDFAWRVRVVLLGPLLFVLLALADGLYVGVRLVGTLGGTRDGLVDIEESLREGNFDEAQQRSRDALAAAETATGLVDHPSFAIASFIPGVSGEARAARALVQAARFSASAGAKAVEAARVVGVTSEDVASAIYDNGQVQIETVRQAGALLSGVERNLWGAELTLGGVDEPSLPPLKGALDLAREALGEARARVHDGRLLLTALPSLLGEKEKRDYLLAFQSLGEARATGGLISTFGVVSTENGHIDLGSVDTLTNVVPKLARPVPAPAWFEESYGPQLALNQTQQVNVSPNFPVVAQALLDMYRRSTGDALDGVLAVDPVALAELLKATGPLRVPGFESPLTSRNAVDVLLKDSYTELSEDEQQAYLGEAVEMFWNRVSDGQINPVVFAEGLAKAVASRHLMIYSTDPQEQAELRGLDADGNYTGNGPNVQLVFHNNYAINKVDVFLERKISTHVRLQTDGSALVTTSIRMKNGAPDGPPSALLGLSSENPTRDDPPGLNRMLLSLLTPRESEVESFAVNGDSLLPFEYAEVDRPVFWTLLEMLPGETATVEATYRVPSLMVDTEGRVFELTLVPQPAAQSDEYVVTFEPPTGRRVVEVEGGQLIDDGARVSGELNSSRRIRITLNEPVS